MISTISVTCDRCKGAGTVPVTRSRWIGGGRDGYRSTWTGEVRCDDCLGYGEIIRPDITGTMPEPTPPAGAIAVGGYEVMAPGFDAETFDRAIGRSFAAGLRVEATDLHDVYLVVNPVHGSSYTTTRETCSCEAARHNRPCHHRARICFELDVAGGRYLPVPAQMREVA